ncbi:50S ribosomal protein L10 [Patescibacteria group bacterium]|nr:50S ribosomal protein L10 [Patescibacteria group bacterium]
MPKAKNIETVGKLEEKLKKAKGLVLTDYQGLTHKQMEDLHKSVKKAGAEYVVVKNSLLNIASTRNQKPVTSVGPTAVLLAYEDEFAPLRELVKFIKTNSKPAVKMSVLGGTEYDAAETTRIASLPSKEGLIAQLMFTLNANTQKLAYLLTQVKK